MLLIYNSAARLKYRIELSFLKQQNICQKPLSICLLFSFAAIWVVTAILKISVFKEKFKKILNLIQMNIIVLHMDINCESILIV